MNDKEYFSHLYEIASHMNKEFSLPSALRKSLEKTVEILDIETGWIWLTEADNKSVYLAASYNLPPALRDHPERLSGWCYCIKQYLSDDIEQAMNISEITCTRLKDVSTGTEGLKFHATIPIITNGQKVGLMNLLSQEPRQLDERELAMLNTISELVGVAIQRTRLRESYGSGGESDTSIHEVMERVLGPQMKKIVSKLNDSESYAKQQQHPKMIQHIRESLSMVQELQQQISLLLTETQKLKKVNREFQYPASPLTKREMEVLTLIKKGRTNKQIAEQLFIAERTVKFHVTSILSKLDAESRTEAVDTALKRGLLSI
jgi:two-component system NarL family sensor kinase